jgi:pimeloyl-ACP methyl ester carboxylesterase
MVTTPGVTMFPGRTRALMRMLTPQRYFSDDFMLRNAARLYGGELRGRPDRARALLASIRAPSALGYVEQLLAMLQFSSLPWLHRIRCPALVMVGDDDPLVRTINGRLLAWLIPDARLKIVAGGGHLFMVMRPQETAAELLAFLRP